MAVPARYLEQGNAPVRADRVLAHALALAIDPSLRPDEKTRELCAVAGHDRTTLGRAWLSIVPAALRCGDTAVMAAERLLAETLELEGADEHRDGHRDEHRDEHRPADSRAENARAG